MTGVTVLRQGVRRQEIPWLHRSAAFAVSFLIFCSYGAAFFFDGVEETKTGAAAPSSPPSIGGTVLSHEMENTVNSFQTPSDYSASSAYDNYDATQASGSVFDFKGDDSPRAWCPRWPVKDENREWLQLDFDGLKVINLLITWGLSSKPDHFVPFFYLLYERGDGRWRDFISHNGTKLIVANQDNTQPKTISLKPPITAQRLRIIPYRRDYSQSMCLKISVFGYAFDASLLSYEIPEGDVYQSPLDGLAWAALNDSAYDGILLQKRDASDVDQRHRLTEGLGVLVDRRVYTGREIRRALEAPFSLRNMPLESHQTHGGVVGWFCRSGLPLSPLSPPCQSRNVTLLFTFDSVRHFTELRIHALNSFVEDIAVFREALVQFSVGGQHFDRYAPPVQHCHTRNITSTQPMWIVIPLLGRVGRFVRIVLTFDSDWIILSEVAFNSSLLTVDIDEEKGDELPQTILSVPQPNAPIFVGSVFSATNQSSPHVDAFSSPLPQAQPPSLEESTDLSLIIGSVCVVGLVLVVSVFVYVLCRLCRGGSHVNHALLGKVTAERGTDGGNCGVGVGASGRKPKVLDNNNGLVASADGRFLTFSGAPPASAFCLANNMAAGDIPSPSKPVDLCNPFGRTDGMLQTLHLMQQQQQQQPQVSTYDPTFRSLLQPTSGFGTHTMNGGAPHLAMSGPTAASFFQTSPPPPPPPPPPDQPLPPLPPITPTSGVTCSTHRPSSTVNPYAASSAVSILANGGTAAATAPMIASTHTDGSMAEYASASLISGQTGYSMRPPSIHGGTGGLIFTPQPTAFPTAQSAPGQDVFFQPTAMLMGTNAASSAVNGNGVFPLMVSCSSGFGDSAIPSLSMLPPQSKNGLFDTLKSIDTLPPHEEMR